MCLLVRRGNAQLNSGDAYILGEILSVSITNTGNQVSSLIEFLLIFGITLCTN
jgi:predicted RecA/RadA family phage recombinase